MHNGTFMILDTIQNFKTSGPERGCHTYFFMRLSLPQKKDCRTNYQVRQSLHLIIHTIYPRNILSLHTAAAAGAAAASGAPGTPASAASAATAAAAASAAAVAFSDLPDANCYKSCNQQNRDQISDNWRHVRSLPSISYSDRSYHIPTDHIICRQIITFFDRS